MSDSQLEPNPREDPPNEVTQLRREIHTLQERITDLQIALTTITEHGDVIEAELHRMNERLQLEIADRRRAEATLEAIVHLISRQKSDLEIILDTITEHGDVLDIQWLEKVKHANYLATSDGLTQIPNRRRFDEYLDQQWRQLAREQLPLTMLLCDIDYFKQYNDTYGHLLGDDCLRDVAKALYNAVNRPGDVVARYGGEEFGVLLPHTQADGALQVAKKLKQAIADLRIPHSQSPISPYLTISIGIASTVPELGRSSNTLLNKADQQLYKAKQRGRNQIVA
ncbi:MAG: GGDEF domain-containing protein [Kaiparowitsia implicata GSE-PSE-MK54-09C]|nr:GGDEF domain-containing protein [Kaiparowitsia implicata GSE-PSE-MK54-09C]